MTNLCKLARDIAKEAMSECDNDVDAARNFAHQSIDGLDTVIEYPKAIAFCAQESTGAGEEYVQMCGGFSNDDTFGSIASKIAFGTILGAVEAQLAELEGELS